MPSANQSLRPAELETVTKGLLHIKFTSKPFDKLETQCVVITTFADCRPLQGNAALLDWRLNGRFSNFLIQNRFEGRFKEVLLMPSEGRVRANEILIIGLGDEKAFNESQVADFTHYLLDTLAQKKVTDFMLSFSDLIPDRFEWRNSVRLLVSRIQDYPGIEMVRLCEPDECIRDAKRRHMDFGMNIEVSFETLSS